MVSTENYARSRLNAGDGLPTTVFPAGGNRGCQTVVSPPSLAASIVASFLVLPDACLIVKGCSIPPVQFVPTERVILRRRNCNYAGPSSFRFIIHDVGVAWWLSRRNRERPLSSRVGVNSGRIELIIWAIPALVILFLGGIRLDCLPWSDPRKPLYSATTAARGEVVSLDWRWLFIYPRERIATVLI